MKKKIFLGLAIFLLVLIVWNSKIYAAVTWKNMKKHIGGEDGIEAIVESAYSTQKNKQTISKMQKKIESYGFSVLEGKEKQDVSYKLEGTTYPKYTVDDVHEKVLTAMQTSENEIDAITYTGWYDHTGKKLTDKQIFPSLFVQAAWRYNIILYRKANILYCTVITMHHYYTGAPRDDIDQDDKDVNYWDDNIHIYNFKKTLSNFGTKGGSFHNPLATDSTKKAYEETIKDLAVKMGAGESKVTISGLWGDTSNEKGADNVTYSICKNSTKYATFITGEGKKQVITKIKFTCYDDTDRLIWYNSASTSLYDKDGNKKTDEEINEDLEDGFSEKEDWGEKIYNYALSTIQDDPRPENVFTDDVLTDVNSYAPDDNAMDQDSANKIQNATSKILTTISNVGIAVSVIMLAILGIKYMLGSVEEKAEYKEGMLPYVIGAAILFGITGFVKILVAMGDKINSI